MTSKTVSATVDQDLYDALVARAASEERTQGVIIRRALQRYIDQRENPLGAADVSQASPRDTHAPEETTSG